MGNDALVSSELTVEEEEEGLMSEISFRKPSDEIMDMVQGESDSEAEEIHQWRDASNPAPPADWAGTQRI